MLFRRIVGCAALSIIAGCTTLDLDMRAVDVPVMVNAPREREYSTVTHFSVEQEKSMFFLRRMFGGGHPDVTSMLQKQLQKNPGDAIINLRIKGDTKEIDIAVPIVIGIAGTFAFAPLFIIALEPLFADLKSYTLEGDIIRWKPEKKPAPQPVLIDPDTGLPVEKKKSVIEFDPETGLPKNRPR